MLRLVVALLLCSASANAEGWRPAPWTRTDTAVEVAVIALLTVDYVQTLAITRDGRESNMLIGASGERVHPTVYFPMVAAIHLAASRLLPQPWRRVAQGAVIAVQTSAVVTNWRAGYSWEF